MMRAGLFVGLLAACGSDSSSGNVPDSGPCGALPVAPGGSACPSVCASCTGATCNIECGPGDCNDSTLTRPADYDCSITCNGLDSCDTTTIVCPPAYGCQVSCTAYDACGDVTLRCGAGDCTMECNGPTESCGGARIDCAPGAPCSSTCSGATGPSLDCAGACGCTPC